MTTAVPLERLTLGRLRALGVPGDSLTTVAILLGWRSRFVRFAPVLDAFGALGQRTVVLNPLDPRSGPPSFKRGAELAMGALEAIDGPRILLTHSMGNGLAALCRGHADGVVLAAPPVFPLPDQVLQAVAKATLVSALPTWVSEPICRHAARGWEAAGFGRFTPHEAGLELRSAAALIPRLEAAFRPDLITAPMLTLLHEEDDLFPVDALGRPELGVPGPGGAARRVELLEGVQHTPTGSGQAAAFVAAVMRFNADLSSGQLDRERSEQ